MLQDKSKMSPEAAKIVESCQIWAQETPSWAQLGPKMLQDRAKMGPEPSKMTPNCRGWVQEDPSCARWPQDAPKTGPRWAQLGTRSPNIGPRSAQEGMLLALGSPVGHGIASQTCKKSFKIPSYLATCYQRGAGGMGRSPLDILIHTHIHMHIHMEKSPYGDINPHLGI